jgi:hypothetical protein
MVDPANEKQMLFVARRRYRAIDRFQFYINPNGRGYLRYPDTCPSNQRWRVSLDADARWVHLSATSDYPLKLVTPPNPPDVVDAVAKIFIAKSNACEGNIFDCATALSFVYMDSLMEAKTPKTLLDQLYARDPLLYLSIDHVHGPISKPADLTDATLRNKFFLPHRHERDVVICHKTACVRASQRQAYAIGHETRRFTAPTSVRTARSCGPGAKKFPSMRALRLSSLRRQSRRLRSVFHFRSYKELWRGGGPVHS